MKRRRATVYIVRHGFTEWNEQRRIVGHKELGLSERGAAQAVGVRELLSKRRLDVALVSPLTRTRETAEIALGGHDIAAEPDERLIELDLKGWEGRTRLELASDPSWKAWLDIPDRVATPAGERLVDVRERAHAALLDGVSRAPQSGGLAIVTHGGVARVLILDIMGMPLSAYHKVRCDCGSVTAIDVGEEGELVRLLLLNATRPLLALGEKV